MILSDLVPLRRRGAYQGYLNVVYSIATSLGGPLGGVIADMWGWRWSFGIQIPLMIISIVIVAFVLDVPRQQGLPESITQRLRRVDFMGACSLVSWFSGDADIDCLCYDLYAGIEFWRE